MELLLLFIILIFAFFIYRKQNKSIIEQKEDFNKLNNKFNEIKDLLENLKSASLHQDNSNIEIEETSILAQETQIEKEPQIFEEDIIEEFPEFDPELIYSEETIEEYSQDLEEIGTEEIQQVAFSSEDKILHSKTQPLENSPQDFVPRKSWLQTFKENNPDIEKFIGENLINKIGILILVLGISFFVKYAIDKDWINETGRVGIGILSGGIVMGVAHRLRKKFAAFSSVFVAGAISIFYLTIGIAFHDYKLFTQTVAFIIMVIITLFSVLVSVSYNRKELAILSLIGGFAVPFMVSTGSGNYKVLLTYIAILNVGMLMIAYFKKWNIVTLLAFIFTTILYSSWFGMEFYKTTFPSKGALFFATLFYFIFSIATVINNIRNKGTFNKIEYFIMLVNTFYYFGIGATIIENWLPQYKGIFTVILALYNLVFAMILYKKFGINKNAIYLLLGLALTFVTITIPFQFNGNYITIFWAAEGALLIWLSQKSRIHIFKIGAIIIQILMMISLLIDWGNYYSYKNYGNLTPFFNKIFITGLFAVISLVATYYLLKKEKEMIKVYFIEFNPETYKNIVRLGSIFLGYFVGILEINHQSNSYFENIYSAWSFSYLYHFIFSAIFIYFLLKFKENIKTQVAVILAMINILVYVFFFHQYPSKELYQNITEGYSYYSALVVHYILLVCIAYFIYIILKNRNINALAKLYNYKISLWILVFIVVFILSNEIMIHGFLFSKENLYLYANSIVNNNSDNSNIDYENSQKLMMISEEFDNIKTQIIKIGFTILWGVLAFVFLIIGIKKNNKKLRIIALSLLGITIVKLFVYDIKNVSETGKIIAFILLGVLILIISFVYQKIKKLVTDQPQKSENDEEVS